MRSVDYPKAIKAAREFAGMTQAALAEACGVSARTVTRWEAGDRKITTEILENVAKAARITVDELVKGGGVSEDPRPGVPA